MCKKSILVELRPNKLLLNPVFDGYKLSLDPIPIYRHQIDSGVNVVQPGDEQYSFSHVKVFSLHNHLYVNPKNSNFVYFVDKNWRVFRANLSRPTINLKVVYQIPNKSINEKERYNISILFASADTALVCDGFGTVYLVKIAEHNDIETWETSETIISLEFGCILCDARIEKTESKNELHIILLRVEENSEIEKKDVKTGLFQTKLMWRVFTKDSKWKSKSTKELSVNGSVDYLALEPGCQSIYVISDKFPKWIYDSEKPIQNSEENEEEATTEKKIYSWLQTNEEITFWLPLPEETEKEHVEVIVNDLNINVKVKGESIVCGDFFQRVDKNLTTWNVGQSKLEIQLTKHEEGLMWKSFIPTDGRGEEILDPALVENVHKKLAHLCTDKEESGTQPSFNSQQLEECDAVSCDTTSLVRMDAESHSISHEVSLSCSQWLFKVVCDPSQVPALCCRHDVDACVWQFRKLENDKTWPHEHLGTFSAFGYVQASKTQKKFLSSPPNLSYVVVCEASHHIYIYRQPNPLNTELKNRQTGKKVSMISKQQLVNLESKEQILGIHATDDLLYVLLERSICVLFVNE